MKYMVLQQAEMVEQIKQKILIAEREHFSLNLQLTQLEKDLTHSAYKLLSVLIRMKKLEEMISIETQKLHGAQSES